MCGERENPPRAVNFIIFTGSGRVAFMQKQELLREPQSLRFVGGLAIAPLPPLPADRAPGSTRSDCR